MHRKIVQLENAEKINNRIGNLYRNRLEKLDDAQNIAVALMAIRVNEEKNREEELNDRRQSCTELRNILDESKSKSLNFFTKIKSTRIQKIKE